MEQERKNLRYNGRGGVLSPSLAAARIIISRDPGRPISEYYFRARAIEHISGFARARESSQSLSFARLGFKSLQTHAPPRKRDVTFEAFGKHHVCLAIEHVRLFRDANLMDLKGEGKERENFA